MYILLFRLWMDEMQNSTSIAFDKYNAIKNDDSDKNALKIGCFRPEGEKAAEEMKNWSGKFTSWFVCWGLCYLQMLEQHW